jgi:DNA replication protein DnaC
MDYRLMDMPKCHWQTGLGGIQDVNLRARVRKLIWQTPEMYVRGANLLIWGDPGAGKSSIASLFARSFRAHNIPSFWITTWGLREKIRDRERFGSDGDLSMMTRVRTVEVLVIDDLRMEAGDGWFSASDLENLVRTRNDDMLPTIITTQLCGGDLYGHPVIEAMKGRLLNLGVHGDDLRDQAGDEFAGRFD